MLFKNQGVAVLCPRIDLETGSVVHRSSSVVRLSSVVHASSADLSVRPSGMQGRTHKHTHTHTHLHTLAHTHKHTHTHTYTCVAHAVLKCLAMVCFHLLVCLFSSLWQLHGIRYDTSTATWMAKSLHQICTQLQQYMNYHMHGNGAKRQRGDSNPCGQSPMDFESITLTARSRCQ